MKIKPLFETNSNPKKLEFIYSSNKITQIVEFWESLRLKEINTERTAEITNRIIRKAIVGTLFNESVFPQYKDRKFTEEEIGRAIKRFSLVAWSPFYLPIDKTSLKNKHLHEFFFNSYAKTIFAKSPFLHYLINPPIEIVKDEFPKFTRTLINLYEDKVLGVRGKISGEDLQVFKIAGGRAGRFLKENFNKMTGTSKNVGEEIFADWVFHSVFNSVSGGNQWKIKPSWFASDITFQKQLPAYLKAQGILDVGQYRGK